MKKILQLFLVAMMSISMFTLPTFMAKASDLFEYEPHYSYTKQITITKYLGNESEVIFPAEIDGLTVRQVGAYVFDTQEQANTTVTSVVLEEGIAELGGNAFKNCTSLESIDLPTSLKSFNGEVFSGCTSLDHVVIPNNVTFLGVVFKGCTNLNHVVIPEKVTIGTGPFGYPFEGVPLANVEFSPNKTKLEGNLFMKSGIKEIHLPSNITYIEGSVFKESSIEKVTMSNNVTSLGSYAFADCANLKEVKLSERINFIGSYCFENTPSLESIKLPDALEELNGDTFLNSGIKQVIFGKNLRVVEQGDFENCVNLVDIQMNLGLEDINRCSFVNIGAEKVVIPDSVTYMGDQIFNNSVNLKEIEYSKSMTKLVNQIIQGCTSYETFYVPYSVSEIAPAAFDGTSALKDVYMGHSVDNIRQDFDDLDVTIHAPLNSYAHTYALDNNIKFEAFEAKCEAISFNKEQMSLMVGYSDWISPKTTPAYTTDTVKYRSSDESIATVDEFGKVTAKKKGSCFIRVGFGDTSVDYPVVVSNPVTDIVLNTTRYEIAAGDGYQLTARLNGNSKYAPDNPTVKWTSENEEIATVDQNGYVTTHKAGSVRIVATSCDGTNISARCTFTVKGRAFYVTGTNGFETSHNYTADLLDTYIYTNDRAESITLTFDANTKVEDGFDFIYIYDQNGKQVGKYTGSELANQKIKVNGSKVKVRIESDDAGFAYGFKVSKIDIAYKQRYTDVQTNAWFFASVEQAVSLGLMGSTGKGTNYFEPDANLTRGMVATILYRLGGLQPVQYLDKFSDVKKGVWYSNAIIWAATSGIVNGYKDGRFGPDDNITRQDLAVMIRNYAAKAGIDTNKVADITYLADYKNITDYARSAIAFCVENKILSGSNKDGKTYVNPTNNASRAEAAKMFSVLAGLVK